MRESPPLSQMEPDVLRALLLRGPDHLGWMCEIRETKKSLTTFSKQVAPDSLSHLYLNGFNSLCEQFYNYICFFNF